VNREPETCLSINLKYFQLKNLQIVNKIFKIPLNYQNQYLYLPGLKIPEMKVWNIILNVLLLNLRPKPG